MACMNFEEKEEIARYNHIVDLNEEFGMTVMMIEHDMGVVMIFPTESWCSISAARSPKRILPTPVMADPLSNRLSRGRGTTCWSIPTMILRPRRALMMD